MAAMTQYATGKRKARSRAWVTAAAGDIVINESRSKSVSSPHAAECDSISVRVSQLAGKYSVRATVYGGGPRRQAGALRHAISKALVIMSAAFRGPIKKEGLLTRDSRVKNVKVRPEGRQKALPILEAVTKDWSDRVQREGSAAFLFYWLAAGGPQFVTGREAKMTSVREAVAGASGYTGAELRCGSSTSPRTTHSGHLGKSAGMAISAVYPHLQASNATPIRSVGTGSVGGTGRCPVSGTPPPNRWVPWQAA